MKMEAAAPSSGSVTSTAESGKKDEMMETSRALRAELRKVLITLGGELLTSCQFTAIC